LNYIITITEKNFQIFLQNIKKKFIFQKLKNKYIKILQERKNESIGRKKGILEFFFFL
jgi:hypothetical protein